MKEDDYIIFPNADKDHLKEKWHSKRHYLNFPYPFIIIQYGQVSSGKSNMIKNIIFRHQKEFGSPQFDRIVVWTKSKSQEWDPEDFELIYDAPDDYEYYFDRENEKNMLVIEDLVCDKPTPLEKKALDYYLKHESSRGLAICINIQDFTQIPPNLRRQAQIINIFGSIPCKQTLKSLAKKSGINEQKFEQLVEMLKPPYDCLTIDRTKNTPYPLRYFDGHRNKFYKIEFKNGKADFSEMKSSGPT